MRIDRKTLIRDLIQMGYDEETAQEELEGLIEWFKSLPEKITLYRIVQVEDKKDINTERPGSHYSKYKAELISNHCYAVGYGDKKFLITVKADKSQIDINQTLQNNILYPNENEITLKNKGKGVKILKIERVCEDDEDIIENVIKEELRKLVKEEKELPPFFRRRYNSKKFEDTMKQALWYSLNLTTSKEGFESMLITLALKEYFRSKWGKDINEVLTDNEISDISEYIGESFRGLIDYWYKNRKKMK